MQRTIPSRIVSFADTIRCKVYVAFFVYPGVFTHGGFCLAMETWRNIEIYTIKVEEGRYLQLPLLF